MQKLIVALFVMAFAIAGASINVNAEVCPGGNKCLAIDNQAADGVIGSFLNTKTLIASCRIQKTMLAGAGDGAGTAPVGYIAFRQYGTVATGAIVRDHYYMSTITPETISINDVFPNGVYLDNVTGTTYTSCHYSK